MPVESILPIVCVIFNRTHILIVAVAPLFVMEYGPIPSRVVGSYGMGGRPDSGVSL
jgi:hypothetical protein